MKHLASLPQLATLQRFQDSAFTVGQDGWTQKITRLWPLCSRLSNLRVLRASLDHEFRAKHMAELCQQLRLLRVLELHTRSYLAFRADVCEALGGLPHLQELTLRLWQDELEADDPLSALSNSALFPSLRQMWLLPYSVAPTATEAQLQRLEAANAQRQRQFEVFVSVATKKMKYTLIEEYSRR